MHLKELRAALDLTLEEIARGIGVSRGTLSKIERDIQTPSGPTLRDLEAFFERRRKQSGLSVEHRLTWEHIRDRRKTAASSG